MTAMRQLEQLRDVVRQLRQRGRFLELEAIDEALDERDAKCFDSSWVAVHDKVELARGGAQVPPEVEDLREEAFTVTYSLYEDSDLAACVSDDLELIAEADRLDVKDEWLEALKRRYIAGEFPRGSL